MGSLHIILATCLSLAAAQSLSFIAVGDWGSGTSQQKQTAAAMGSWARSYGASFVVSTGDNIYSSGVTSANDPQFKTKWKNVYTHTALRNLKWYISTGNHDHGSSSKYDGREKYQLQYSRIEPRWVYPHYWYTFTKKAGSATVQFVVIETQSLRSKKNSYLTQRKWFESTLKNSRADYLIVVGHHPVYCSGNHGPGSTTVRALLPIMQRYKVDLYMSGHDHNLEHLRKARNPDIDHVLSGGGGRSLYRQSSGNRSKLGGMGIQSVKFFYTHGFVGLTVSSSQIQVNYIDANGRKLYSFLRRRTRSMWLKNQLLM